MNRHPEQASLWPRGAGGEAPPPLPKPSPRERRPHVGGRPVLVGTSGFSFPDWVGPFYPRGLPAAEWLPFYAEHFPAVEVNSTYYGIPEPRVLANLVRKTPSGFEFLVKANQRMTHEEAAPEAIYDDFHRAVEPLRTAGRFHGVLAQFPWRFRRAPAALARLEGLRTRFADVPLFVEFRHDSWIDEAVFRFLEEHGIGYCSVDEPPLRGLVPPVARRTTDTAYVRLHGRNRETWWGRGEGDRYDYDYRKEELNEWLGKIRELAERAEKTYVFFNNCHAGQAARNARLMMAMLQGDLA